MRIIFKYQNYPFYGKTIIKQDTESIYKTREVTTVTWRSASISSRSWPVAMGITSSTVFLTAVPAKKKIF